MTPVQAAFPTGDQFLIKAGEFEAVATEVGGGLRSLTYGGQPLIDGFDPTDFVVGSKGQVLAPWPNRLRQGHWEFEGRSLQLPVEGGKSDSASHGLVRWVTWRLVRHAASEVVLAYRLHPQPGYPFLIDLTVTYEVDALQGLTVALSAVNVGRGPAPVALGMHPYLRPLGGGLIDSSELLVPAASRTVAEEPDGWQSVETLKGTSVDFRQARRISDRIIDFAFTDLSFGADERFCVKLSNENGTVILWASSDARWLQVYTGDNLPAGRRRGIAVEPMTAPANALATGQGLKWLEEGEELWLKWGVSCSLG